VTMAARDRKTLYLVDGHAQFFRAYHAIRSPMSSPVTGEPTGMVFGFTGMLLSLLRDQRPDYLAVAIDVSDDRGTFRSDIYEDYKANRDAPPEDFHPQVARCLEILEHFNIPILGVQRYEADDVIATVARALRDDVGDDLLLRIVSRDKDLTQLLRDGVELFDPMKDAIVTPSDIFKTEGVQPAQVLDILSLMGDTADNVPGVPGIGPKTAAKLVMQYGSIEGIFEHIDEIKGKRHENLVAHRDQLSIARRLITLADDVPLDFTLAAAAVETDTWNVQPLHTLFADLGFNMHRQALGRLSGEEPEPVAVKQPTRTAAAAGDAFDEGGLFSSVADAADAPPIETAGAYTAILDEPALTKLIAQVQAAGVCAIDTETDSLQPVSTHLCGVSIAITPGEAYYIPTRSPEPDTHLDAPTAIKHLAPMLTDESITKIGHNLKFDRNVLRAHEATMRGRMFDTMIASYVIDATRSSHKMDVLARAMLDHTCIPLEQLLGKGKSQRTFDAVPLAQAVPYAAEDADITLQLRDVMAPQLKAMDLQSLFDDVEMPLVAVLAELEFNGIRVDPAELETQREKLQARIDELRAAILDAAPHPFNPDSPRQLAAALFNDPDADPPGLGLKPVKKGKTGPSTDVEVLEKLAADPSIDSAIPQLIVEYRQLTKLVNTYLVALGEAINPKTQRVHASFHQTVAATGRLSSSDPNLQNIPIRTDVGREIRRAFVAEDGCMLITADYSQIELRLLAHLSQDPALIDAFRQDMDIHTAVAAEVFNVSPDDVTSEQRGAAKMVNFGIVYGITAFGLARRLGGEVSQAQAAQIIEDYKARYARIDAFLTECVDMAKAKGYVATVLGRRRAIPQIAARNPNQRRLGERMAINSVVQGSAADLIKLAMIDLHRVLPDRFPRARMLLQIHDELVLEAPDAEAEQVRDLVVQRMEQAMTLDVPLKVGSACAKAWIEAK
jgi:DNA polymerase-1